MAMTRSHILRYMFSDEKNAARRQTNKKSSIEDMDKGEVLFIKYRLQPIKRQIVSMNINVEGSSSGDVACTLLGS